MASDDIPTPTDKQLEIHREPGEVHSYEIVLRDLLDLIECVSHDDFEPTVYIDTEGSAARRMLQKWTVRQSDRLFKRPVYFRDDSMPEEASVDIVVDIDPPTALDDDRSIPYCIAYYSDEERPAIDMEALGCSDWRVAEDASSEDVNRPPSRDLNDPAMVSRRAHRPTDSRDLERATEHLGEMLVLSATQMDTDHPDLYLDADSDDEWAWLCEAMPDDTRHRVDEHLGEVHSRADDLTEEECQQIELELVGHLGDQKEFSLFDPLTDRLNYTLYRLDGERELSVDPPNSPDAAETDQDMPADDTPSDNCHHLENPLLVYQSDSVESSGETFSPDERVAFLGTRLVHTINKMDVSDPRLFIDVRSIDEWNQLLEAMPQWIRQKIRDTFKGYLCRGGMASRLERQETVLELKGRLGDETDAELFDPDQGLFEYALYRDDLGHDTCDVDDSDDDGDVSEEGGDSTSTWTPIHTCDGQAPFGNVASSTIVNEIVDQADQASEHDEPDLLIGAPRAEWDHEILDKLSDEAEATLRDHFGEIVCQDESRSEEVCPRFKLEGMHQDQSVGNEFVSNFDGHLACRLLRRTQTSPHDDSSSQHDIDDPLCVWTERDEVSANCLAVDLLNLIRRLDCEQPGLYIDVIDRSKWTSHCLGAMAESAQETIDEQLGEVYFRGETLGPGDTMPIRLDLDRSDADREDEGGPLDYTLSYLDHVEPADVAPPNEPSPSGSDDLPDEDSSWSRVSSGWSNHRTDPERRLGRLIVEMADHQPNSVGLFVEVSTVQEWQDLLDILADEVRDQLESVLETVYLSEAPHKTGDPDHDTAIRLVGQLADDRSASIYDSDDERLAYGIDQFESGGDDIPFEDDSPQTSGMTTYQVARNELSQTEDASPHDLARDLMGLAGILGENVEIVLENEANFNSGHLESAWSRCLSSMSDDVHDSLIRVLSEAHCRSSWDSDNASHPVIRLEGPLIPPSKAVFPGPYMEGLTYTLTTEVEHDATGSAESESDPSSQGASEDASHGTLVVADDDPPDYSRYRQWSLGTGTSWAEAKVNAGRLPKIHALAFNVTETARAMESDSEIPLLIPDDLEEEWTTLLSRSHMDTEPRAALLDEVNPLFIPPHVECEAVFDEFIRLEGALQDDEAGLFDPDNDRLAYRVYQHERTPTAETMENEQEAAQLVEAMNIDPDTPSSVLFECSDDPDGVSTGFKVTALGRLILGEAGPGDMDLMMADDLVPEWDSLLDRMDDSLEQAIRETTTRVTRPDSVEAFDGLQASVTRGATAGAVARAGDYLLDVCRSICPDDASLRRWVFDHPAGREAAKFTAAVAVHQWATHFPDMVPYAEKCRQLASRVIEHTTADMIHHGAEGSILETLGSLADLARSTEEEGEDVHVPDKNDARPEKGFDVDDPREPVSSVSSVSSGESDES